ncbi:MAG: hypothetical protein JOZ19_07605 [Rubrobacter sp.]|nr:hypothetical protein [Rubrobacter sp.]
MHEEGVSGTKQEVGGIAEKGSMRAIAIEGFGGKDRLELVDLPTPREGEEHASRRGQRSVRHRTSRVHGREGQQGQD